MCRNTELHNVVGALGGGFSGEESLKNLNVRERDLG